MDARQRIDDAYNKKKLQKLKFNSDKRSKFHQLKFVLIISVLGTFVTILSSPTVSQHRSIVHTVSRWIWGKSDPRYASDFDINWYDILRALQQLPAEKKIRGVGLLNFDDSEIRRWRQLIPNANHEVLHLNYAAENITWDSLYPEWIDEEQDDEVPSCPHLANIEAPRQRPDLVSVKLPCHNKVNWSRDIARLHLQISAAGLATSCKGIYPVYLLFVTSCPLIPNVFACKDQVVRVGNVWLYKPNLDELRGKLQLPMGSCELAVPLGAREEDYTRKRQREAYATVLHSANVYVCGAIAAAQSIRMAGSTRDLVILVDDTISDYHKSGLELAGWKIKKIQRIRNPKAEKDAYNEWNYSKFRLWQLTDYDKIIFIDSDLLILKNIDFLFSLPEISATGNHRTLFNSGVMVIEPSNCTFQFFMDHINDIESYNGGDQGYLNEIFTWWHRIPRHMNFLKNFWIHDDEETKQKKIRLFAADPPVLYVLHYLGTKPWICFRDYDCNWNVDILQEFASDVAHKKWWKLHDAMPETLQQFCLLRSKQKAQLEWDRREAEKANYSDGHWRIKIKDERIDRCIDPPDNCNWKGMLNHWGEPATQGANNALPIPTPPALDVNSFRM